MLSSHQQNQNIKNIFNRYFINAFMEEFLGNSGHFLILKSCSDLALYGWKYYVNDPTEYLLIFAISLQTWYLSKDKSNRFLGNLIGVSVYTLIDLPQDGLGFFRNFSHLVFWLFSIIIAILQEVRFRFKTRLNSFLILGENLLRTLMIFAFYLAVKQNSYYLDNIAFLENFFKEMELSHKYLFSSLSLVGLFLGLKTLQINYQEQQLQATAKIFKNLAKWGLGIHAVERTMNQPDALDFEECDRTILFMDIRGFTPWCEQNQPEQIATVLNDYYRSVEPIASQYQPLRITFTGDEIMAIYATPQQGIEAARGMQEVAQKVLTHHGIGAGCAVHCGRVIEGLFGSEDVKTYTAIGDVVNTAKRIESATPKGEIVISDAIYQEMNRQLQVEPLPPIMVKGKISELIIWRLR